MIFTTVPIAEAESMVLAHTLRCGHATFGKGQRLTATDLAFLSAQGLREITGARLDNDDVEENLAASQLAGSLAGENVLVRRAQGGRCNLYAKAAGLVTIASDAVHRINLLSSAVTVGTLSPWSAVAQGEKIATVKIIPLAVPYQVVNECCAMARGASVIAIAPFAKLRVVLIVTDATDTPLKLVAKAIEITERRIAALGSELAKTVRCKHESAALSMALSEVYNRGCDLILICGAKVTMDSNDIVPTAIRTAGGEIEHFGMPVEPGNMLLLARIKNIPVVNLPGCARTPRENGFDWVLRRLLAKLPVSGRDLISMGVGGLLREHEPSTKPQATSRRIAALILAGGRSSRMGRNKLLLPIDGVPMIEHVVDAALHSQAYSTIVVTGHDAANVGSLLLGRDLTIVHNADYASGMASSLRCGLRSLPADVDAVLVMLADMPYIGATHIDRLIDTYRTEPNVICVPHYAGRRGNPVLFPRRYFERMSRCSGDQGARELLDEYADQLKIVAFNDSAISQDIDTQAAIANLNDTRDRLSRDAVTKIRSPNSAKRHRK